MLDQIGDGMEGPDEEFVLTGSIGFAVPNTGVVVASFPGEGLDAYHIAMGFLEPKYVRRVLFSRPDDLPSVIGGGSHPDASE